MKSTLFILSFCLLFWGCSCKKENNEPEPKKPEPTTDGRNTFYCEINGVPYYQKFVGGQPDFPRITGAYSLLDSGNAFRMTFKYQNKEFNKIISFAGKRIISGKKILLSMGSQCNFYLSDIKNGCDYIDSIFPYNTFNGYIIFSRFDPNQQIFSGTFEFKNWLPDSIKGTCDTVKVTNGIFDLKL